MSNRVNGDIVKGGVDFPSTDKQRTASSLASHKSLPSKKLYFKDFKKEKKIIIRQLILPEERKEALPGHGPLLPPLSVDQLGHPPTGRSPANLGKLSLDFPTFFLTFQLSNLEGAHSEVDELLFTLELELELPDKFAAA